MPQSFFLTNPPSDRLRTGADSSPRPPDYIHIEGHMTCLTDERLAVVDKRSSNGAEVNLKRVGKWGFMTEKQVQGLNELLAGLRQEGEAVESGSFSVAADKALHKLEQYSLKDPALFVLEALGLAVCGAATFFRVFSDGSKVVVEFDGTEFQESQFENPSQALFQKDAESSSLHLALLLSGLSRFAAGQEAALSSCTISYRFDGQEWKVGPGEKTLEFNRVVVERPFRFLSQRLKRAPSLLQILKTGRLAPLKLSLNNKGIFGLFHAPAYTNEFVGQLCLQGRESLQKISQYGELTRIEEIDEDFSAAIYLASGPKAQRQGIVILRNGICYRVPSTTLGPGVSAVIVTRGLTRDLGGAGIMLEFLRQKTQEFVREIIRSDLRWRLANRELIPLLDSLPQDTELNSWATQFKAHLNEDRTSQNSDLITSDSQGLVRLEQYLKQSERINYHPNKLIAQTAQQLWALPLEGRSERLSTARDLVLICLELEGEREPQVRPENPLLEVLFLRREGDCDSALVLCRELKERHLEDKSEKRLIERMELELLLAQERIEEGREAALRLMSVEKESELDAEDVSVSESMFVVEYLAHICQLKGEEKQFDRLYGRLQGVSYCDLTNALRAEVWIRGSRGRLNFGDWLKRRVTASGLSAWFFHSSKRRLPGALSQALQGRLQEDLEPGFRQFFENSGRIYTAYMEAVRNNVGHQLRQQGEFLEADRLLATIDLLGFVVSNHEILVSGRSYYRAFG